MGELRRTVLYDAHVAAGAKMVEFGGWEMPLQYPRGIVAEHLATRKSAGLFDVSHMGRFVFRGAGAVPFLQHVLANNAMALSVGQAQYTMVPNAGGGAVDDAYLYRFNDQEYLLVVNAANRQKDWDHFSPFLAGMGDVQMVDRSDELAMISLQGPRSKEILAALMDAAELPEPRRNALSTGTVGGIKAFIARTGYTGEPLCFEFFVARGDAAALWDALVKHGATPAGLGARDTLRLEAALPLYGHELGTDPTGQEIPIFACPLAKFAVSFSPLKGDYVGRPQLLRQYEAFRRFQFGDYSLIRDLPRMVRPLAVVSKAIARAGAKVFSSAGKHVGYVTSGTMAPYWQSRDKGLASTFTEESALRPIAMALIDSDIAEGQPLQVDVRGKMAQAQVVGHHMRAEAPPYARPILAAAQEQAPASPAAEESAAKVRRLLEGAIQNTTWRRNCVNLIPSEMTTSPMVRLLSVMDPAFRYAEHRSIKAFEDAEIFYYQGTDFIEQVEVLLEQELCRFLGCDSVETRALSGQMANAIVFSAMVEYINRASRAERRRLGLVMNHAIFKGGHLSSQPMGALKDFVARDPRTEMPSVVNFPVLADNPYQIDVKACGELIAQHRPELIIFGKSLVLHPEPIAPIRKIVQSLGLSTVLMYDAAHVLGLLGEHFQQPFSDGADIVTASTHKTYFGTQRGMVAMDCRQQRTKMDLMEALRARTFPGATSNHHLGTMLGLLMAAYEMNHFKDAYQRAVLANAKTFARALKRCGLNVAGDERVGYTQTHQVLLDVGYGRGAQVARRLEENNIIVNYQAGPFEEGFSAAGFVRMGVAEMTRMGMEEQDFGQLAQLMCDVIIKGRSVGEEVKAFRGRFAQMRFCFASEEYGPLIQRLHSLI